MRLLRAESHFSPELTKNYGDFPSAQVLRRMEIKIHGKILQILFRAKMFQSNRTYSTNVAILF